MSRILLTGVNGQVGFELQSALTSLGEVIAVTRQDMDLTNQASILQILEKYQPTIIVNPAAYTAVDKAELEQEQAYLINRDAPKTMAEWAVTHNALLVHYSTDYVFDGTKEGSYVEEDIPNPQSVYGLSKLLGEQAIQQSGAKHLIFRTSWVFGVHGNNFIKTIIRLAKERESLNVVADQHGAPTSARLIAQVTTQVLAQYVQDEQFNRYGVYHLTSNGQTTWHEYARLIVDNVQQKQKIPLLKDNIVAIPSSAYPVPAKRPTNSCLNCDKITHSFNVDLTHWPIDVLSVIDAVCQ
ncbi:MAG: dTDP-4-dehydrorhamnose reductase [Moraxellaceae bacterium]|nr:dTDP-4-dehydrorhamnose reductase [Moraxellaceae bacterium]MCP5176651.1 dTDP-4-dehydrorhamnose reductase [Moraxellaceae bacterium]